MQVCYLINQLAPGGAPTLLLNIVENTDDEDISYTVCYIEGDDNLVEELRAAGADVVDFGANFKFDLRALYRMTNFFRSQDFDMLHAHLPYSQTLGRLFARLGGVDIVISTQHNVPDNYHPITKILERITRRFDARTIAVSEGVERAFTGESAKYRPGQHRQWCTIYNGIDVSSFNEAVKRANPEKVRKRWNVDADLIYLNISRYVPPKSQTDLVAAMDHVIDDAPDAHLFIVGWGELESELRTEVETRGLGEKVTITGKVPTVHEYYALSDIFVSSSIFEGMPIAHLEAMAAELPIVATEIPGVREVVTDGENGYLVSPGNPEMLAGAMIDCLPPDRRNQFSQASYSRAAGDFSIEQTVDAHLSLYRELLENT